MLANLVKGQLAAVTVARILLGITFFAHGWQKFFTFGVDGVAAGFAKADVPLPTAAAWFSGLAELVGGALLIVGFAVPVVALVLVIDMVGAILTMHLGHGFFAAVGGPELPLVLIAGLLAVAFVPASLGVDALLLKRSNR